MDDETSAILAAKLKGDMEDMIRRVMAEAMQDYNFWLSVHTPYAMQEAIFRNGATASNFASIVTQVMLRQMQK